MNENSKPQEEELAVDFDWNELEVEEQEESLEEVEEESVDEESEEVEQEEVEESEEQSIDEDEEVSEDEELSVVESIRNSLGFETDQEFEDTEEGIQLLVEAASQDLAGRTIEAYFEEYPDVKELLEYRRMGGDPDKFFQTRFPEINYSEVELREDDEAQQEQIIRQELKSVRGYTSQEIEEEIKDYRNGGILESKARRALAALRAKQEQDSNRLLEEQRETLRQQQKAYEDYTRTVKQKIESSTSFAGIKIPSSKKAEMYDYLFKPVKDGKTQAMLNVENVSLEQKLAIDYLLMTNFDFSDLVSKKAKDMNIQTLRKRLRKGNLDKKDQSRSEYIEELAETF